MMNIVEKYSVEGAVETDEGVVAIEYVIVAAAIVVALGGIWLQFGNELSTKLGDVVNSITT